MKASGFAPLPPARPHVAYLTDHPEREALIRAAFEPSCTLRRCRAGDSLIRVVGTGTIDLVLLDLCRRNGDRQDALVARVHSAAPTVPQHVLVRLEERGIVRTLKHAPYRQAYLMDTIEPESLRNSAEAALMADPVRSALSPMLQRIPNPLAHRFGEYCARYVLNGFSVEQICEELGTYYQEVERAFHPVEFKPQWVLRAFRETSVAYATERGRGGLTLRAKAFHYPSPRAMYESFKRFAGWPIARLAANGGAVMLLQRVVEQMQGA